MLKIPGKIVNKPLQILLSFNFFNSLPVIQSSWRAAVSRITGGGEREAAKKKGEGVRGSMNWLCVLLTLTSANLGNRKRTNANKDIIFGCTVPCNSSCAPFNSFYILSCYNLSLEFVTAILHDRIILSRTSARTGKKRIYMVFKVICNFKSKMCDIHLYLAPSLRYPWVKSSAINNRQKFPILQSRVHLCEI